MHLALLLAMIVGLGAGIFLIQRACESKANRFSRELSQKINAMRETGETCRSDARLTQEGMNGPIKGLIRKDHYNAFEASRKDVLQHLMNVDPAVIAELKLEKNQAIFARIKKELNDARKNELFIPVRLVDRNGEHVKHPDEDFDVEQWSEVHGL